MSCERHGGPCGLRGPVLVALQALAAGCPKVPVVPLLTAREIRPAQSRWSLQQARV